MERERDQLEWERDQLDVPKTAGRGGIIPEHWKTWPITKSSQRAAKGTFSSADQRFWGAREVPADLILVSKDLRVIPKHPKTFIPTSTPGETAENINQVLPKNI